MKISQKLISILFAYWAGLISAISFLEAWLKFRADGVTREIGLSIGTLVFTVLNRIELVLLLIVLILFVVPRGFKAIKLSTLNLMFWGVPAILLTQTIWLLPQLMQRAELIIHGQEPSNSVVHIFFILFEFLKLILLIVLSLRIRATDEKIASKL